MAPKLTVNEAIALVSSIADALSEISKSSSSTGFQATLEVLSHQLADCAEVLEEYAPTTRRIVRRAS